MCKQAELCFFDADPIYLMAIAMWEKIYGIRAIDLVKYVKGRLK